MPLPSGPAAPSIDDAEANAHLQRNQFYHSLAPKAQERFLETLEAAQARGLDEEASWAEAAHAAQTAYSGETKI